MSGGPAALPRHILLGGALTICALLALPALAAVGVPYVLAQTFIHVSAVTVAYPISSRWVFGKRDLAWLALLKFHISYLFQLPVGLAVLIVGIEVLGTTLLVAQLASMAAASVVNFVGLRFLVFR